MDVLHDQSSLTIQVPFDYAFDYKTVYNTDHIETYSVERKLCSDLKTTIEYSLNVLRKCIISEKVLKTIQNQQKTKLKRNFEDCSKKLSEMIEELK